MLPGREEGWRGRKPVPVLCQASDGLLLSSENGSRGIAQRFPPYFGFRHNPAVIAAAIPRQRRMIGGHQISGYG